MVDLWAYAPDATLYLAGGVPSWLDDLSFSPAPPHHRMGTRILPTEHCLGADQFRSHELELRNRLLDEQHAIVFAALPSADAASHETLELVSGWLAEHGLPAPLGDRGLHPLERAGRAVQEDLCLMVNRDGAWHLDAAVLCFPSMWSLVEKLGRPIRDLHDVVPHYDSDLADRVDGFFDRMVPGRAVWRRNLSVKPYPLLFLPFAKHAAGTSVPPAAADGSPYWLRTEFQTLQRLPASGSILFTIKLQLAPAGVLQARPDVAHDLLNMYDSWDDSMHSYKTSGSRLHEHFVPWLRSIVQTVGDDR